MKQFGKVKAINLNYKNKYLSMPKATNKIFTN